MGRRKRTRLKRPSEWRLNDKWLAGFFDGEGCISIMKRVRPQSPGYTEYRVHVQVTQIDRRPLYAIKKRFGGSVSKGDKKNDADKVYRWMAEGFGADRILEVLKNEVIVKRDKVLIAIKMRRLTTTKGRRPPRSWLRAKERLYRKFKELGSE